MRFFATAPSGAKKSCAIPSSTSLGWRPLRRCGRRAHIRIDVLFHYCAPRVKSVLYIFGDLAMLFVAVLAFYWSYETVMVSVKYGSVTDGLRLPKFWFLMAVPLVLLWS